ncbi:MAG: hypothetical protein ABIJ16_13605 [Bacteroidota bacterium]
MYSEQVTRHIRELLFLHECVVVPDFGGFVTNYSQAKISESHSFVPPARFVIFNRHLRHNDGLLISRIAAHEKTGYNEAGNIVRRFVQQLSLQLSDKKDVILPGIGSFSTDNRENIIFESTGTSNFLPESYGLGTFQFPELTASEALRQLTKKVRDHEAVRQVITHSTTKRILIGVPLVLMFMLLPYKMNLFKGPKQDSASLRPVFSAWNYSPDNSGSVEDAIENMTRKENALLYIEPGMDKIGKTSCSDTIVHHSGDTVQNVLPEEITPLPVQKEENTGITGDDVNSFRYHVIAGSFTENFRAEKFCGEMKQKGYDPHILERQNGKLRISVSSHNNREEALTALEKYRADSALSVWLLTN